MKKTAVKWLIETLQKPMLINESDFENIIKQAIELEKQQISDAYIDGEDCIFKTGAEYYETKFIQPE